jgi:CMP-N,N'-diacetyllegionaminic acid synthase
MEILGIIPARAGSKGIKKKNTRKLNGNPLLQYSIDQALNSKISRVIVNTEDLYTASLSQSLGAEVPFLRPKKLAGDKTTTLSVIKNTISYFKKQSYFPDIVIVLQPTNPFRPKNMIDESISLLKKTNASSVLAVKPVDDHPDIMMKSTGKFLKPMSRNFLKNSRRQSRSPLFTPSGLLYTFWTKNLEKYGDQFGPKIYPYLVNDSSLNIDIDMPFDFFIAEMTAKYWKKCQKKL